MQIFESASCVVHRTNFDDYLALHVTKKKKKDVSFACIVGSVDFAFVSFHGRTAAFRNEARFDSTKLNVRSTINPSDRTDRNFLTFRIKMEKRIR